MIASYSLKVAATFFLFYVSLWELPIIQNAQLGRGFWTFSWDSVSYHVYAQQIVQAWTHQTPLPHLENAWPFYFYVAVLYRFAGPLPLVPALLNAWYGTWMLLCSYRLIGQLTSDRFSTRWGLLALGFWPSLILWSTQVLKESLILMLLVTILSLLISLWSGHGSRKTFLYQTGIWTALVMLSFALSLFRGYAGLSLSACAVVFAVAGVYHACRRRIGPLLKALLLLAAVCIPATLGNQSVLKKIFFEKNLTTMEMVTRRGPEYLEELRRGVLTQKGSSSIDPSVRIRNLSEILFYIPRGLSLTFLAPFPSTWFGADSLGGWGRIVGCEVLFVYLLLLYSIFALHQHLASPMASRWLLFCFVLLLATLLSIAVPNAGTLFRLRLQVLIPWILFLASTESFSAPSRLFHRLSRKP